MMKKNISRYPCRTKNSPVGSGEFIFLKEVKLFFPEFPFYNVISGVGVFLL